MSQAYRVPTWLEQSANAPGIDPQAVELHNRLNGALERGDELEALLLLRELNSIFESSETLRRILRIEVQYA